MIGDSKTKIHLFRKIVGLNKINKKRGDYSIIFKIWFK